MATSTCRGQVILELVMCISFFLLVIYLAFMQNTATSKTYKKHRFGSIEQRNNYVTKNEFKKY